MKKLREKLTGLYGVFGLFISLALCLFLNMLPFMMIDGYSIIKIVLVIIFTIFPSSLSILLFWIWGLVCAIKGAQDIWTIIYYVIFAIGWGPVIIGFVVELVGFIVTALASLFSRQKD